jgi:hypothetical protein
MHLSYYFLLSITTFLSVFPKQMNIIMYLCHNLLFFLAIKIMYSKLLEHIPIDYSPCQNEFFILQQ